MSDLCIIPDSGLSLSNNDIKMLAGTDLLIQMMRNRITIRPSFTPTYSDAIKKWRDCLSDSIKILESMNTTKFHYVEQLQENLVCVWFESHMDYEYFRNELIAQKLAYTHDK
tara:strand:+ start:1505 stop:1840 length:336 start_codon:yes stop_codon:yes gene_type:complete